MSLARRSKLLLRVSLCFEEIEYMFKVFTMSKSLRHTWCTCAHSRVDPPSSAFGTVYTFPLFQSFLMFLLHGNVCSLAARRQTRVFAPTLRFPAPGTSFASAHALNRFLLLVRVGFTFSRVKNRPFPCLNLLLPFPLFHSEWTLFRVWHHLHFLPRLGQVSRPLH